MDVLGIDIGGTGIKGAVVDTTNGELKTDRLRLPTPEKSTPEILGQMIADIARENKWRGPIGCGFPGVIRSDVVCTAANLDKSWVGVNLASLIKKRTGCTATVLNDADAAGLAEVEFGAGRCIKGVIFVITIGTGIGTAVFHDGVLLPNTELGHLILHKDKEAEEIISERTRTNKGLSWKQWAKRVNRYLVYLENLFWPELFILGGGGVKKPEKFLPFLETRTAISLAKFGNKAGIIGAALAARKTLSP